MIVLLVGLGLGFVLRLADSSYVAGFATCCTDCRPMRAIVANMLVGTASHAGFGCLASALAGCWGLGAGLRLAAVYLLEELGDLVVLLLGKLLLLLEGGDLRGVWGGRNGRAAVLRSMLDCYIAVPQRRRGVAAA